jgi:hypothetical protein
MNPGMEFALLGVLVSGGLLCAVIAAIAQAPLRSFLERVGVYRFVWHRNLFDVSVFIILWWLSVLVLSSSASISSP